MTNFFKSLIVTLQQRLTNPLMGSYAIFWGLYNWKFVYYLLAANLKVSTKIHELDLMYSETRDELYLNTTIPAVFALASLIFMPHILRAIQAMQIVPNRARIRQKVHMDFVRQKAILQNELELENLKLDIESSTISRLEAEEKKLKLVHSSKSKNNKLNVATPNIENIQKINTKTAKPIVRTIRKTTKPNPEKATASKKLPTGTYTLNKGLHLHTEGDKESLNDFMNNYKVTSNFSRYLLFTHYLKEIKGIDKVGVNELYTCFKHLKIRIPLIEQGLRDTSNRKGWLDTSSSDDLIITTLGENAITHDLLLSNNKTE